MSTRALIRAFGILALLAPAALVAQQGAALDPATLLKAPTDSWPTYHGDYSGQRHSRLAQITPDNVAQLTLAWSFQTGQTQQIKSSPILADGVGGQGAAVAAVLAELPDEPVLVVNSDLPCATPRDLCGASDTRAADIHAR